LNTHINNNNNKYYNIKAHFYILINFHANIVQKREQTSSVGVEVSYSRIGILLNADGCSSWRDSKRQLELGIVVQGVHHQHRYMLLSH